MNKLSKYIIVAVGTAAILFLAWYFSNILTCILISAVLALVGNPIMDFLTSLKIGKIKVSNLFSVSSLYSEEGKYEKKKIGLLTHASTYFEPFPFTKSELLSTVVLTHFICMLQLRKQFWIFTKFPIKPSWHLFPAIHSQLD